jgi:hypothetical protein
MHKSGHHDIADTLPKEKDKHQTTTQYRMNRGGILVQGELYTISLLLRSIQVFNPLDSGWHPFSIEDNVLIFKSWNLLSGTTVKPVFKGHSREPENVAFMSSCHYSLLGEMILPLHQHVNEPSYNHGTRNTACPYSCSFK